MATEDTGPLGREGAIFNQHIEDNRANNDLVFWSLNKFNHSYFRAVQRDGGSTTSTVTVRWAVCKSGQGEGRKLISERFG